MDYKPKRDKQKYLDYGPPFEDRDTNIRFHRHRVSTIRKDNVCFGNGSTKQHVVKKGEMCYVEHALVDRQWCSSYLCLKCYDQLLDSNDE